MWRFLLIAVMSACVSSARPRPIDPPDPAVGDMRCAPQMSIHQLIASWDQPVAIDPSCPR